MPNRDSLRTELKLLRDDVHRITLELKERALKVEKLQNKFETISSKHHASADDEGEPKSQVRGDSRVLKARCHLFITGCHLISRALKREGLRAQLQAPCVC